MNISEEIQKLTGKLTDGVAAKAKDSAISTLSDPEFKKTVNQFTKDWFEENKFPILLIVGSFAVLSILAVMNILSNFSAKK